MPIKRDVILSCGADEVCVFFASRGIGPTAWDTERTTHIRRRFVLLGQTLDGMRVWDIRRALQALGQIPGLAEPPIRIEARGNQAVLAAYASLWEPRVREVVLDSPPFRHRDGPTLACISRILEIPQAVALLLPEREIVLRAESSQEWRWLTDLAERIGGDVRLETMQP